MAIEETEDEETLFFFFLPWRGTGAAYWGLPGTGAHWPKLLLLLRCQLWFVVKRNLFFFCFNPTISFD